MRSGAQKRTGRRRERALPSAHMLEFKASSLTAHRGASGGAQQTGEGCRGVCTRRAPCPAALVTLTAASALSPPNPSKRTRNHSKQLNSPTATCAFATFSTQAGIST